MAVGRVVLCQKLDRVLCQKLDRVLCQTLKWLLTEHSAKYTNGCWQSSTLPNTQMPVGRVVLCQKLDRVLCQTLKWLLTEHSAKYPNGCWQSSTLPKVRQSTLSKARQSTLPNPQMAVDRVVLCQKLDRVLYQTLKWLLTEHSAKYKNGCWQSSTLPKVRQSTVSKARQSTLPNPQMAVDRALCQIHKWLLAEQYSAKYPNACWQSSTLPKVRQSTLSNSQMAVDRALCQIPKWLLAE